MLMMKQPLRAPHSPKPRISWLPAFDWSDLVSLCMLLWLIYKQRMALAMMAIPPGPANWVASAGAALVLTGLIRRAAGRWQIAWWLIASLLISGIMYADIIYYRQFGDLVSVAALKQAHQLSTVSDSVTVLMKDGDGWLFADLPFLAALLLLPSAIRTRWFAAPRRWAAYGMTLAGVAVVALVTVTDPIVSQHYYGHTMVSSRMGLISYHAFDLGAYGSRMLARVRPKGEAVREVRAYFDEKLRTEGSPHSLILAGGTGANNPGDNLIGAARGKNVIMLQLESYQSFPIGLKIGDQEITPNLNRLMAESIYFENFYHQTGQGVTADADLLANCSLHPTRTGAVYYDYAHNQFACMPSLLRQNGYKAVAMQGMPADFWNLSAVYPRIGFERYYSSRDFDTTERVGIGLSDESFLRQSVAKLKALPQPYYAFLVTLTSHGPFDFDDLPRTLDLGDLKGTKMGHYLDAIHYTDKAVGQFIDQLKAEGILDNAVLVVYGDHQGIWRSEEGTQQLLGSKDEVGWTQTEKRVPLFIRLPGGQGAGVRTHAAGQADLAPTVAGLLGLSTADSFFMGRNLFAHPKGIVPFYRGSAVDDTHLFLSPDDSAGAGACYQLSSGAEVDLSQCLDLRKQATDRLHISNLIIERDLIPSLVQP